MCALNQDEHSRMSVDPKIGKGYMYFILPVGSGPLYALLAPSAAPDGPGIRFKRMG